MQKSKIYLGNVKTIIWDCDNTIWIHRKDEVQIVCRHLSIEPTEEFSKQYYEFFKDFNLYFSDKKVTVGKIIWLIKKNMPILAEIGISAEVFYHIKIEMESSYLNEDALDAIKYLKSKNYRNIVLTDWMWDTQIRLLKKYGVLPYIDRVYTCDNQYLKKNPKTVSRIITPGKEISYLIVGDSIDSDITFAANAGIKSMWFNPGNLENNSKYKPTMEISSLLELCRVL